MTDASELLRLAGHHEEQGIFHAKAARNNATWYHAHAADTAKIANHFAVSAPLRAIASTQEQDRG